MKIISTLILICFSVQMFGQPGALHKSFGENGQVITTFSNANVTVCKGLIQKDNKIIVVGEYETALLPYNGFIAIRYMPDGLVDLSFGDSGKQLPAIHLKILYHHLNVFKMIGKYSWPDMALLD